MHIRDVSKLFGRSVADQFRFIITKSHQSWNSEFGDLITRVERQSNVRAKGHANSSPNHRVLMHEQAVEFLDDRGIIDAKADQKDWAEPMQIARRMVILRRLQHLQ